MARPNFIRRRQRGATLMETLSSNGVYLLLTGLVMALAATAYFSFREVSSVQDLSIIHQKVTSLYASAASYNGLSSSGDCQVDYGFA